MESFNNDSTGDTSMMDDNGSEENMETQSDTAQTEATEATETEKMDLAAALASIEAMAKDIITRASTLPIESWKAVRSAVNKAHRVASSAPDVAEDNKYVREILACSPDTHIQVFVKVKGLSEPKIYTPISRESQRGKNGFTCLAMTNARTGATEYFDSADEANNPADGEEGHIARGMPSWVEDIENVKPIRVITERKPRAPKGSKSVNGVKIAE